MFFRIVINRIKKWFPDANRRTDTSSPRVSEYETQNLEKLSSLNVVDDEYNLAMYHVQMAFVKMVSKQIQGCESHTQCPTIELADKMEEMHSELEKYKQNAKLAFDKLSPEYQERVILEKLSED